MYCVNCGVKLADSEKKCPLCGVTVYHPELKQPQAAPLFPQSRYPSPQMGPRAAQIILTTLFLLPVLITLLCDLQINGKVTWAGYVTGALMTAYVIVVLPLWFRRPNPVIFVPCDFAAVGLFLLYIDLASGGHWFLSLAFPVTAVSGVIVTTVTVLLRYIRRGRLYIFGGMFLAFGAAMPLLELLICVTFPGVRFLAWSLYPAIGLVLLGGTLIFLAVSTPAREKMERKLFI